ncbi:hypothetical protein HUB97_09175 [Halorubraceae archaeon YAN]|nr:hypothetical protein [Halorubraceae archaeon YAN]
MSKSESDLFQDERVLQHRSERTGWDRFLTDAIYYGLGQIILLTFPIFWLLYQTPFIDIEAIAAGWATLVALVIGIGFGRGGRLPINTSWPSLTNGMLGSADGYRTYLSRAVYLSTTFMLGAYIGAYAAIWSGSLFVAPIVGGSIGLIAILMLPTLLHENSSIAVARIGYNIVGLGVGIIGSSPFDIGVGDPTVGVVLLAVAICIYLDATYILGT